MTQPQTMTFVVAGMHCASCGLLIDDAVEELEGVERCETDSRRGRTVVRLDPATVTAEGVVAAIADAGYRAEPVVVGAVAEPTDRRPRPRSRARRRTP